MINLFRRTGKPIEKLADELRKEGPRRFANWNNEAFDSYIQGPLSNMKRALELSDHITLNNYLRLVFEGVGAGWLKTTNWDTPSPTFLAHCLARLVPYQIANVPKGQRSDVLRDVWNLGEGIAHEPQWLNQYAISQTDWSTEIISLQEHLKSILEPVLSHPKDANWNGKFNLNVIDLRKVSDGFLPGRMFLASPAVLCVENEFDSEETIGILLQHSQASKVLGVVGKLPEHIESFAPPSVALSPNAITINGTSVSAPLISSPSKSLCAAIGFVVVAAEDSQRLWLVEAA